MKSRFLAILAWLAVGHAVLLGLIWLLLRVPESNAVMLAVSLGLAVAIVLLGAWVQGVAIAAWHHSDGAWLLARRGLSSVGPFLLGLALFGLVWWATAAAAGWWDAHRGEIDASLMARFGWTRTRALHGTVAWLEAFVRYAVGLSLALTLVAAWPFKRKTGWSPLRWLGAALSPRRLVAIALLAVFFAWLPWQAVYWRPRWLAPNWQEAVFTTLKLAVLYVYATIGWALLLRTTPRS